MNLISFLIKGLGIPGYNPAEDIIEGGIDFLSNRLEDYRESVKVRLKNENFTDDQIKSIETILAGSNSRFITNTPAFIGDKNADCMVISRTIFDDFNKANGTNSDLAIYLEDEEQSEKIIKGISIVISPVVSSQVITAEYAIYLTQKLNETNRIATENNKVLEDYDKQFAEYSNRLDELEQAKAQGVDSLEKRIKAYQEYVKEKYTQRIEGNSLLGEESLSEMYMQPFYYKSRNGTDDVEQLFSEFISKEEHGVLWITGEPGHGKTSMCIKAVADYRSKKRYQQARGVFWFSLNPHGIPEMVKPKLLSLEKVFSWTRTGGGRNNTIEPSEIERSFVLLDGFDELKSSLEENNISDDQFHAQVNLLAEEFHLHVVVTSRTRALIKDGTYTEDQLKRGDVKITCNLSDGRVLKNSIRLLAPLTEEKQTAWINDLISFRKKNGVDVSDLERYKHTFQLLQENEDLLGLVEVPILFRMIVQNCFEPTSNNRVELYRELFDKTLIRQDLYGQRNRLHSIYREIAFRIFAYDNDYVDINKAELKEISANDAFLYQYYLYIPEKEAGQNRQIQYRITFLHRSFYEYFLSEFFYEKLKMVKDKQSGKVFLKYLWPMHIDYHVLDNLRYCAKNDTIEYAWVLSAIEETEAILPEHEKACDSKKYVSNFDRASNIFWNALSICNSILQQENSQKSMELTGRITELFSRYDCNGILLTKSSFSSIYQLGADLRHAHLSFAILTGNNLEKADLRESDLRCSNLSNANLYCADLSRTNLSCAILNRTSFICANLNGADLSDTNMDDVLLRGADLSGANLGSAKLRRINLEYATLRGVNLSYASLNQVNLNEVCLDGANLQQAKLYDTYLCDAKIRGADLSIAKLSNVDLSRANLSRADLSSAKLNGAVLGRADLSCAKLLFTNLSGSDLKGTNLSGADLRGANLSRADLSGANLSRANLSGANLSGANLSGADLNNNILMKANFENAYITRTQYEYISRQDIKSIDNVIIIDDDN